MTLFQQPGGHREPSHREVETPEDRTHLLQQVKTKLALSTHFLRYGQPSQDSQALAAFIDNIQESFAEAHRSLEPFSNQERNVLYSELLIDAVEATGRCPVEGLEILVDYCGLLDLHLTQVEITLGAYNHLVTAYLSLVVGAKSRGDWERLDFIGGYIREEDLRSSGVRAVIQDRIKQEIDLPWEVVNMLNYAGFEAEGEFLALDPELRERAKVGTLSHLSFDYSGIPGECCEHCLPLADLQAIEGSLLTLEVTELLTEERFLAAVHSEFRNRSRQGILLRSVHLMTLMPRVPGRLWRIDPRAEPIVEEMRPKIIDQIEAVLSAGPPSVAETRTIATAAKVFHLSREQSSRREDFYFGIESAFRSALKEAECIRRAIPLLEILPPDNRAQALSERSVRACARRLLAEELEQYAAVGARFDYFDPERLSRFSHASVAQHVKRWRWLSHAAELVQCKLRDDHAPPSWLETAGLAYEPLSRYFESDSTEIVERNPEKICHSLISFAVMLDLAERALMEGEYERARTLGIRLVRSMPRVSGMPGNPEYAFRALYLRGVTDESLESAGSSLRRALMLSIRAFGAPHVKTLTALEALQSYNQKIGHDSAQLGAVIGHLREVHSGGTFDWDALTERLNHPDLAYEIGIPEPWCAQLLGNLI